MFSDNFKRMKLLRINQTESPISSKLVAAVSLTIPSKGTLLKNVLYGQPSHRECIIAQSSLLAFSIHGFSSLEFESSSSCLLMHEMKT